MILLRFVLLLAIAAAGIWYFLAEPDRLAALDAIKRDMMAEAELRQARLSDDLQTLDLAAAMIARSAPVAALMKEPPDPEPLPPAAQGTFDGSGFETPAPPPAAVPDERAMEKALEELKSLEALAGLSAVRILKKGESAALPASPPSAALQAAGTWDSRIDAAFRGRSARALFVSTDGEPSAVFFAPYFSAADVPAIVIAEASLSEAASRWADSEYQLSLSGGTGSVILSNAVDAGAGAIEITREIPSLDAVISVAKAMPEPVGPWALRSGAAMVLAALLLLLWELNLSRRRLRSEVAEARRARDARPADVVIERSPEPDHGKGQNAAAESLALLARVSDSVGQEISRPLAAIRNHAEAARRGMEKDHPDSARDNIRQVSNLADRIARIVTNMRGFEAAQPYQLEPVSIRPVVHEAAVTMLERDPALGDFFFMEVADDVAEKAFVRADKTRLSQVIDILLASSWDACRDQRRPELVISIQQTGADMVVAIDYGGRPEDRIGPGGKRVSVGAVAEASGPVAKGVSYAIAKSIVEGMGGRLTNRGSALGGGRIEIVLPKFKPDTA